MSDDPTLGEVMRQVRALVEQVRDLVQEVRNDYIRKDLYEARHAHVNRRVDDLEKDINEVKTAAADREKARIAFQRQIAAGIIIQLAVLILTALFVVGGLR